MICNTAVLGHVLLQSLVRIGLSLWFCCGVLFCFVLLFSPSQEVGKGLSWESHLNQPISYWIPCWCHACHIMEGLVGARACAFDKWLWWGMGSRAWAGGQAVFCITLVYTISSVLLLLLIVVFSLCCFVKLSFSQPSGFVFQSPFSFSSHWAVGSISMWVAAGGSASSWAWTMTILCVLHPTKIIFTRFNCSCIFFQLSVYIWHIFIGH